MASKEQTLKEFSANMLLLISEYKRQREELEKTKKELEEAQWQCDQMKLQVSALDRDYNALKTARMLTVGDGDLDAVRQRVAKLIRDVNKCITLVNNQSNQK